jgi:hypothetical protein
MIRAFWNIAPCSLALMREAVRTYETLVYSNENTRRYNPEGSNLHTRRRENLKSHTVLQKLPRFLLLGDNMHPKLHQTPPIASSYGLQRLDITRLHDSDGVCVTFYYVAADKRLPLCSH